MGGPVTRRALGAQDAAWLHLDRPDNPMAITVVLTLAEELDVQHLRALVQERLIGRWPPFGRRVARGPFGFHVWEDDPELDLVRRVTAEALAPGETLEQRVVAIGGRVLDPRVLPWELVLVGGRGIVGRFHHCLADGVALARVLTGILDSAEPERPGPRERRPRRRPVPLEAALELERLLTLPPDPITPLRGELTGRKRFAWAAPVSLERLKDAGRRRGATINDVLLAALAGALRDEVALDGVDEVRAIVPVDVRRGRPVPPDLGNRLGMVLAPLPVGEERPERRIDRVRADLLRLKESVEPTLIAGLLDLFGHVPATVQRIAAQGMAARASLLVTNVPGPREVRRLGGVEVERVLVWVPQVASIGLGVAFFSYAGQVHVGVVADEGIVADPHALAAGVVEHAGTV